jgi:mono/diheme cytochrome c family protein
VRAIAAVAAVTSLAMPFVARGLPTQSGGSAPLTPFQRDKARALLRTQLPCLGCHELDGEGGRRAPSLTTVGERRSAAYIRAMIDDPQRRVPGSGMPRPAIAPAVRDLIGRFFAEGARGPDVPMPPAPPAPTSASPSAVAPPSGAALYAKWCASCHGATGKADGPDARFLPVPPARHADAAAMARRTDDALFDVIAVGGPPYGRSARMPAFGGTLRPDEIRAVVAHIRSLCKCQGPAWSRDGVTP